jgi:outer membrane protein W
MLPMMKKRVDIYTKLGVAHFNSSVSGLPVSNLWGAYVGLGADYKITPHIAVNLDVSGPVLWYNVSHLGPYNGPMTLLPLTYSVGLAYCF